MSNEYYSIIDENKENRTQSDAHIMTYFPLPPVKIIIPMRFVRPGSMIYFPPLDRTDNSYPQRPVGPLFIVKIHWGDVVPGSTFISRCLETVEPTTQLTIPWSQFQPGVIMYISGPQGVSDRERNELRALTALLEKKNVGTID